MKINFGCGNDIKLPLWSEDEPDGWMNVDFFSDDPRVHKIDLNSYPLNFDDNVADEILCYDIIEHLIDPYAFSIECIRILQDDGSLKVALPKYCPQLTHLRNFHNRFYFNPLMRTESNISIEYEDTLLRLDKFWISGFMSKGYIKNIIWRIYSVYEHLRGSKLNYIFIKNKRR